MASTLGFGSLPCNSADALRPILDASPERPFVVAQLGQSLDARIATENGDSCYINGPSALDHLHALRASVDAVLVGIGTVLADDPQLNVRRVQGRDPARVVIDPSGRLPIEARCMQADGARRLVVRATDSSTLAGIEVLRLPRGPGAVIPPRAILEALMRVGLRRVLIEGGSRTISAFIDAGCVDRLHLLVAPVILGSGKPGLELHPITTLKQALRPSIRLYPLEDGEVLYDCDLRSRRPEAMS